MKFLAALALLFFGSCALTEGAQEAGRLDVDDMAPSVRKVVDRLITLDDGTNSGEYVGFKSKLSAHAGTSQPLAFFDPPLLEWCDLHDELVDRDALLNSAQKETYKLTTAAIRTALDAARGR